MGGHGAISLALKHPGLFKALSSMSGVMDLSAHHEGELNESIGIHKVLGDFAQNGEAWRKNSVVGLAAEKPEVLKKTPLLIGVGAADSLTLDENRRLRALLEELKIPHEYKETEGGHDWAYWGAELPAHLEFLAGHLKEKKGKR